MNLGTLSDRTNELLRRVANQALAKATFDSTRLPNFDLEPAAKSLVPVLTPLRNMTPRVKGDGGNATNWNAITGINVTNLSVGVSEGKRGAEMQVSTSAFTAPYAVIGMDASVNFEAQEAGQGYDDIEARAALNLLRAVMIGEEKLILGGNRTLALGAPVAPVLTSQATGGSIGAGTFQIWVAALTLEGYLASSISGGIPTSVTRNNLDGSTSVYGGGSSNISPASNSVTLSGSTNQVSATATAKRGAVAYAWFFGTSAATATLVTITTINSVNITSTAGAGTQTASGIAADNSTNALIFDGLLTVASVAANNAYFKSLDGTFLTSDGAAGINEIDAALQSLFDNFRLGPNYILVSSQEARNINKKVIANSGAPLVRFTKPADDGNMSVVAGTEVRAYFNKFTGQIIPLMTHPNLPAGTILGVTSELPYPLPDVENVFRIKARREYYEVRWPVTTRRYDHGVYASELLQHYAPFSMFLIQNVGNG
jgi:hypothetical protein